MEEPECMKIPSLSRIPKNKSFNYIPRFYKPEKEFLEQNLSNKTYSSEENTKNRIRASFRYKKEKKEGIDEALVMRLWIIVFLDCGFAAYYFNNFLPIVLSGGIYLLFRFLKKAKTRE